MVEANKKTTTVGLVGCILLFVVSPLTILWRGFVFLMLWHWFVAGRLPMPEISLWESIGLMTIVAMLLPGVAKRDDDDWQTTLGLVFVAPLASLAIGYLIHSLMH